VVNPVTDTATTDFAALGLTPALVQAAAAAGWHTPTPVQAAAIPAVLAGRDLLARAPTGAGKTAAFVLPLLQRLQQAPPGDRRLAVLVLAPTRELAAQTARVLRTLAPQQRAVLAVGGLSINPQLLALRGGVPLLVATPGRLLDLVAHNALRLDGLQCLVLDEADRLLDLGFADEVGRVLALLPAARQTLLFSATLPDTVSALAAGALRDPLVVQAAAAGGSDGPAIAQRAIVVDSARRTPLLRQLLRTAGWPRVLVFVATQHASERVADKLRQAGVPAAALHGDLSAGRRAQVLADFGAGALQVLVATDLAARGIDLPQLGVVLNHDLPRSAVDHVHRIGRAGRAGAAGLAISFVCADAPGSEAHFRLIEKRQGLRVPRETVPGFEPAAPPVLAPADPHGGVKGRRKSKKDKLREAAALAAKAGPGR
jgi:superfamily II DNA/RNA helicase